MDFQNPVSLASRLPMYCPQTRGWMMVLTLVLLWTNGSALAQAPLSADQSLFTSRSSPPVANPIIPVAYQSANLCTCMQPISEAVGCASCNDSDCQKFTLMGRKNTHDAFFYSGADFLLVRPHFSEAIAFAEGNQTGATIQMVGRELAFSYDGSLRAFFGYQSEDDTGELRFTYWHLQGEVSVDGSVGGAGQFIVDPFGNLVGSVALIDPSDARFPGTLPGGDLIQTKASVEANLYDLALLRSLKPSNPDWSIKWSVGIRIVDIEQYYESVVTNVGALWARGDFDVGFIGAGPRLGFETRRSFGCEGRFSLFANGHSALIVGNYDVNFRNIPTPGFTASQSESLTRTLHIMETEVGAKWNITDSLNLSVGWLFQAGLDLGTSGGQFGGLFAGADDSNIMSFDGLVVSAEWLY